MPASTSAAQPTVFVLPEAVRLRVIGRAASVLGTMDKAAVPAPLQRIAAFQPSKRARLGAGDLAAALESAPSFRQSVAADARADAPELAASVEAGVLPPSADVVEAAELAFLIRPEGWQDLVAQAVDVLRSEAAAEVRKAERAEVVALQNQLEQARSETRAERRRSQAASQEHRRGLARVQEQLRQQCRATEAAETNAVQAQEASASAAERGAVHRRVSEAEVRRLKEALAERDREIAALRRDERASRAHTDARLAVLLEVLGRAAEGLRAELGLPIGTERPADVVAAGSSRAAAIGGGTGLVTGPDVLHDLLVLPGAHLLVDGYNVTMLEWSDLPLETQRTRLVTALAALSARTGAEVTAVFDGAEVAQVPATRHPRGVRVVFSDRGEIADQRIRLLVAAEPLGRLLLIASNDKEVAVAANRPGGRAVASGALLRALGE